MKGCNRAITKSKFGGYLNDKFSSKKIILTCRLL